MKVSDEAIRIIGRRRWNPDKCKPLVALMWLLGALALVPVWIWLAKGVIR